MCANSSSLLSFNWSLPVEGMDAGMVVSRGYGRHIRRVGAPFFDLLFVREGVLSVQEGDCPYEVKPGQALLLWPGRPHFGTADYPADLRFFWLHFKLVANGDHASGRINAPQYTDVQRPDFMTELMRQYINDQQGGRSRPETASLLVMLMLYELTESAKQKVTDIAGAAAAERAYDYIRTNYRSAITPADVAQSVGYNQQYLSRVFNHHHKMTITDAIHRCRIIYARLLLNESAMTVSEIATACGFADFRYFCRLFHRYEGMTASQWRKLCIRSNINLE